MAKQLVKLVKFLILLALTYNTGMYIASLEGTVTWYSSLGYLILCLVFSLSLIYRD
jgi:hypothetical protein